VWAVAGQQLVVNLMRGSYPGGVEFGIVRGNDRAWVVSPDLNRVAAVDSPDPGSVAPGDLIILEPGGGRHILAHQVVWTGGDWPQWTPDSKKIMVRLVSGWSLVDIASGTVTSLPGLNGEYFTWSTNHAYLAYAAQEKTIVVARPDGTVASRTPLSGLAECHQLPACPFAVQAVSDDGRLVALGHGNTDPSHTTEAHLVLDTRTGQLVPLPKVTGQIDRIYFRPDGGMLVRSSHGETVTFFLLGPDLKVTATFDEPSYLSQSELVAYYPHIP
jgi:hypothetical protein